MKKLIIYRKRQIASALIPYWIVTEISKSKFMEKYNLRNDTLCQLDKWCRPIPRMQFDPQKYGIPILNGKKLELEIKENVESVFAVTYAGLLSNELLLDSSSEIYQILITTRDGWKHPSYPKLTLDIKDGL